MPLTIGEKIATLGKGWRKITSKEQIGDAVAYAIVNRRAQLLQEIGEADLKRGRVPSDEYFKYDDIYVIDSPV